MIRIPKQLTSEAKTFWQKHAPRCIEEGTLTEATVDAFTLLCITWQLLMTNDLLEPKTGIIKYVALTKTFERQGLQFGISSKKKAEKKLDLQALINEGLDENSQEDK